MISVAAWFLASVSGCSPVPGADRLWEPKIRWAIMGEVHGTNEAPDAFVNLVCLAAESGRPVTVAVEYSADGQSTIDAYLSSNGNAEARAALLRLREFTSPTQDGRDSVAFLRMWDRLRRMKQAGWIDGVVAADIGRSSPAGRSRDATMARNWIDISAPDDALIMILAGNVHAMRKPMHFPGRTIVTAGSLMPVGRTITVNVVGDGGTAWTCEADGCGRHDSGPQRGVVSGISYTTDPDRDWDASYELGMPTTAAMPVLKPAERRP